MSKASPGHVGLPNQNCGKCIGCRIGLILSETFPGDPTSALDAIVQCAASIIIHAGNVNKLDVVDHAVSQLLREVSAACPNGMEREKEQNAPGSGAVH